MEWFVLESASQLLLTNPTKVSKVVADLKVGKTPCTNDVLYRALKNSPKKGIKFFFTNVFIKGPQVETLSSNVETPA